MFLNFSGILESLCRKYWAGALLLGIGLPRGLMEMSVWCEATELPVRASKLSLAFGCQSAAADCVLPWFNFYIKVKTVRGGGEEWCVLSLEHLSLQLVSRWIAGILGFASCGSHSLLQSLSCVLLCSCFVCGEFGFLGFF